MVVQPNSSPGVATLCDNVTSSVYIINSRVKNLKSAVENVGTPNDNQQLRNQIQAWQQEVNEKVKSSSDDINKLNLLARSASKQQKLQIKKITSHCKDAVEGYCKIQQFECFLYSCLDNANEINATNLDYEVVQKLRSHLIPPDSSGFNDDSSAFITQEQIQIQRNLEFDNEMLIESQQSVQQIENYIVTINSIMKQLGALVHEQGTSIDTIENRIESAYENVRSANQELTTAAQYQTKSRKKKLFLVVILILILSILIGVIVWSAKS